MEVIFWGIFFHVGIPVSIRGIRSRFVVTYRHTFLDNFALVSWKNELQVNMALKLSSYMLFSPSFRERNCKWRRLEVKQSLWRQIHGGLCCYGNLWSKSSRFSVATTQKLECSTRFIWKSWLKKRNVGY